VRFTRHDTKDGPDTSKLPREPATGAKRSTFGEDVQGAEYRIGDLLLRNDLASKKRQSGIGDDDPLRMMQKQQARCPDGPEHGMETGQLDATRCDPQKHMLPPARETLKLGAEVQRRLVPPLPISIPALKVDQQAPDLPRQRGIDRLTKRTCNRHLQVGVKAPVFLRTLCLTADP